MSRIIDVIEGLDNLLSLKSASEEDINNIEKKLNIILAEEYKDYIIKYGAILADNHELTGFAKSKHRNVIEVTLREWELNEHINHDLYVVESAGIDGIIIWQDKSGKIYESKPNYPAVKISDSLADYLEIL